MKKQRCELCGKVATTTHTMRVEGSNEYHPFLICESCLSWRRKVLSRAFNNILRVDNKAKERVVRKLLKLISDIDSNSVDLKKAEVHHNGGYSKYNIVVKRSKVLV